MSRTRRSLRIVSALCLALLFYAAIPHSHGSGPAHRAEPIDAPAAVRIGLAAGAIASPAILLADLAHESHSSTLELESHPCTLCREGSARAVAAQPAARLRLADLEKSPCPLASSTRRAERLLAERHAARAPPRA
jgi:hypothetical protein